ncbi:MAG: hypothetical protein VZQ81_00300 [Succiniclasticum sp.]|jgi:hypothetical protein|nr:hypothetical protein [Succiniclasticum sp.]MEE3478453.1 hypothetical protein [Succiniclasticum sp.]
MHNVYDLIADFYGNSSEWSEWLSRRFADDFIRTEAFRGATEDELYDTWNCVLTLLVYCGNVDIKMGDMRTDDFIDCFGWCSRNIADFALTYETAEQMLTVWSRLLHFLKMRHAITDDSFADKCRSLVLDEENKRLLLVDDEGNFRYDLLKHHQQIDTDLNAKVYLDMDNYLDDVLYDMRRYFSTSEYKEDRDNATALGFGLSENMREYDQVRGTRDEEAFWEYFLFDYHLLATGKTPIRTYVDTYQPDPKESVGRLKAVRDILDSLLTARFVLLTEVRRDKEAGGWYYCKDLLSGGILYLSLPIDDDFDTTDVLFVGHAMDNGNMVFTYLRGLKTTASAELRIKYVCSHLQQWYAIQKPEAADMEVFLQDNAAVVQLAAAKLAMETSYVSSFPYTTEIRDYQPAPVDEEDTVIQALSILSRMTNFGFRETARIKALWSDFAASPEGRSVLDHLDDDVSFFAWAIACMIAFTKINDLQDFPIPSMTSTFRISRETIYQYHETIRNALQLTEFDPRYVGEPGMLAMVLKI